MNLAVLTTIGRKLKIRESLYLRIVGIFFLILIFLGFAYTMITVYVARNYSDETTQRLNAKVAAHLLREIHPFENGKLNEASLNTLMQSMMAVNPAIEVYLIDNKGDVLSSVVLHQKINPVAISVEPIKAYLEGVKLPIYGEDPRNPGKYKVFSAAAVYDHDQLQGYVYVILASKELEGIGATLRDSYLAKIGLPLVFTTLVASFLVASIVLWMAMRSLNDIVQTTRKFESGDFTARIPNTSKGELATLSATINSMAESMARNVNNLKEVDKLRRDLIANVSHDIRTPVSVIHGYIETLIIKSDSIDHTTQKRYLHTILKSTERLKYLMNDLFELSRLESRQVKPKVNIFSFTDLLLDLNFRYKIEAFERNIDLFLETTSDTLYISADALMIERVLQNLMDNAMNYTPENGSVTISTREEGIKLKVTISNTGPGIPSHELSKIFDRYYKSENNSTHKSTGLGLAIVKNILEIHNCDIAVQSDPLGVTSFSFELPLALQ